MMIGYDLGFRGPLADEQTVLHTHTVKQEPKIPTGSSGLDIRTGRKLFM